MRAIAIAFLMLLLLSAGLFAPPESAHATGPPQGRASPLSPPNAISLSITNPLVKLSLLPTSGGTYGQTSAKINVQTDTDGYILMLEDTDDNTSLRHTEGATLQTIPSIADGSFATKSNFPDNYWGYSLDGTNFTGVPVKSANNPKVIRDCHGLSSFTPNTGCDSPYSGNTVQNTYIHFAAKIDNSLVPGNYTDTLTVSVSPISIPPEPPVLTTSTTDWASEVTVTASNPNADHRYFVHHYDYYVTTDPNFVPDGETIPTDEIDGSLTLDKINILEDGTYYVWARTVDTAGLISGWSNRVEVKLDVSAPTAHIDPVDFELGVSSHRVFNVCEDERNINGYYFGTKADPDDEDFVTLNPPTTYWTMISDAITEGGTYYLHCRDVYGNIGTDSITYMNYSITNLIETLPGETGVYTDENYIVSSVSGTFLAEEGTVIPPASLYTIPTPLSSAEKFDGVSTTYGGEEATLSQTALSLTENNQIFYMWFDRNVYPLVLNGTEGVLSTTGAGNYKYGTVVPIDTEIHHLYTFMEWRTDAGNNPVNKTSEDTTVTITSATTLTAVADDITPPDPPEIKRETPTVFSFTNDTEDFDSFFVSTSPTPPKPNDPGWQTETTYTIDNSARTWYVYAKDTHGNISVPATINSYSVDRTVHGTYLTTKDVENDAVFSNTIYVLDGTPIYSEGELKVAYKNLVMKFNDEEIENSSTHIVRKNTIIFADSTPTAIVNGMSMLDIRQEHCNLSNLEEQYTVTDPRNGERQYLIARLADGRCWMTQNIALPGGTTITSEDSEMPAGESFTLTESKPSGFSGTFNGEAEAMYDGSHIDATNDSNDNTGAFYTFYVATAGNSAIWLNREIDQSICPKAWTLPDSDDDWPDLFSAYNNDYDRVVNAFHVAQIGRYHGSRIQYQDQRAYWWAARSASASSYTAHNIWVGYGDILGIINPRNTTLNTTDTSENRNGHSVRCVLDNINYAVDYYTTAISAQSEPSAQNLDPIDPNSSNDPNNDPNNSNDPSNEP